MSLGLADLVAEVVIQDGLKTLRENPAHLEYILLKYVQVNGIRYKVGENFVANAMSFIMNNRLTVRPNFVPTHDEYPNVMIGCSYEEEQKYFGDYGGHSQLPQVVIEPLVYARFDIVGFGENLVEVSPSTDISNLFIGIPITNGVFTSKITHIIVDPAGVENTQLLLVDNPTPGIQMAGWEAKTFGGPVTANIGGSLNQVTIQAKLASSGDADLHRVLTTVVRYCLKRGRKIFDHYGIQELAIAQTPMLVSEQEHLIFETIFTMTGKELDTWIDSEYHAPDYIGLTVNYERESGGGD